MEEVDSLRIKQIPHDVMIDILKNLPGKSLLRFKCVSKTWYNLVNSSNFTDIHYNHDCLSNDFVLLKRYIGNDEIDAESNYYKGHNILSCHSIDESFKSRAPNVTYFDNYIGVSIAGPCNGIVCIGSYRTIFLYNPTLREFWELPPSQYSSTRQDLNHTMQIVAGIGFDPKTNDYKVIRIFNFDEYPLIKDVSTIEIYNLSTNSWREIDEVPSMIHPSRCFKVLFNGVFHLCGTMASPMVENWIVSFNFSTELFQNIPYPDGLVDMQGKNLVILNECLALICYPTMYFWFDEQMPQMVDIWVMKEYGVKESWTKEFTIGPIFIQTPLSIWKNETEMLIESKNGELVSCNLLSQEIKNLDISGDAETLEVVVCKESLISIKKEREEWL
ncbi:F-box protein CPR1-like [Nicotiana tabacum]|uniref:F-box protein CPR1-like n=1 Tax=Nicotiana tabacum TaxID=4097 RepID=A0A1S4ADN6_TOBAC|nr:F-box protein CPR1-like [Nicotiana tomentosiformis]XP_016474553.1 PREDICTED: F-box protein CPR30-like [Nicotiana tabacum]